MDILLVDDNDADARLVQEALDEGDHPAFLHRAATGEQALEMLREAGATGLMERLPDLVLLDLNLPGLHGLEVLGTIKSDPALLRIPVVVLTSSAARRDVMQAYGAHANAYLVKPDDFEQFVELVATVRRHWLEQVLTPGRVD